MQVLSSLEIDKFNIFNRLYPHTFVYTELEAKVEDKIVLELTKEQATCLLRLLSYSSGLLDVLIEVNKAIDDERDLYKDSDRIRDMLRMALGVGRRVSTLIITDKKSK